MIILFSIFICIIAVQLIFWLFVFGRLHIPHSLENLEITDLQVSIVVVLKNGAEQLEALIPALLNQQYPDFHVWFVDDHSTDQSADIIRNWAKKNSRIKYFKVKHDKPGKKQALKEAIPIIDSEIIVVTDVDCVPASDQWLGLMVSRLNKEKELVLGYSPVFAENNMLNMFIRYETFITGIQYLSFALWGIPYMGVGRNMAYKKKIFDPKVYDDPVVSGDDDMLVQRKATGKNTSICIWPEAHVFTSSKSTLNEYLRQKRRHVSSSAFYKITHKIGLGLFAGSQGLIFLIALILLLSGLHLWLVSALLLIRYMFYYFSAYRLMGVLNEEGLRCRIFTLDFLLSIYYIVIAIMSLSKKDQPWN